MSLDNPVLEAATKTELETEPELELEPEPDLPPEDFCNNLEILYKERSVWTRHLCNTLQSSSNSRLFNKLHNLPYGWNLNIPWAEEVLGEQMELLEVVNIEMDNQDLSLHTQARRNAKSFTG
uniref:Heavy metal tolerance protein n=1 Tax=Coccidioides posadasii RMSCC 3488 TaxID=454284 RepID=A0A0J6FF28_COCPO|nr:heavy metal tolerance protein [Coccidioides posadasii RMSCC 3488]